MGQDDDPASLHRYLYAGVDGVNACDPSGRESLGELISVQGIQSTLRGLITTATIRAAVGGSAGGAVGAAAFWKMGLSPLEGAIEGARIGGELAFASTLGEEVERKAVINGFVTGTIACLAKYFYDLSLEPKNVSGPNYTHEIMREFIRGFASGVEDEVIDGKWLQAEKELQPYIVGAEVLLQDFINTSSGTDQDHIIESFTDAACQTLLEVGADKIAEVYLRGDPPLAAKISNVVVKDIFNEAHKDAVLIAFSPIVTAVSRSITAIFIPHA